MKDNEIFTLCRVRVDKSKIVNPLALKSLDEQGWPVGVVATFTQDEHGQLLAGVNWPETSYLSRWWYPEHLEQITLPSIKDDDAR